MKKDRFYKNDPFLLRAVEHWLDSANELWYQPIFCQWLLVEGFSLKYSIKNTNFEYWKDVVAVDPQWVVYAYQLKWWDIDQNRWRSEVKPEIEVLIDCLVQHPDINRQTWHVSYLVTNWEISETVRHEIVQYNENKWKDSPLRILTRGDLLKWFQEISYGILPADAFAYKSLMDLLFQDGAGLPNIAPIQSFMASILHIEASKRSKEQRKRDISAALLYANMIIGPYRQQENYTAVIKILTVVLSLIMYMVDKNNLEKKYWIHSRDIIWEDLLYNSELLEKEIENDGFNFHDSPIEKNLIPFRKFTPASTIFAFNLSKLISWKDISNFVKVFFSWKYTGSIVVWWEASLVSLFLLYFLFKKFSQETAVLWISFLRFWISQIIARNGKDADPGNALISPYYDINFFLKLQFGLLESNFEDSFEKSSYYLKSFIYPLVRSWEKEFITTNWKAISYIHFEEFLVDNPYDLYLWRNEISWDYRTIVPKKQKSWKDLENEANTINYEYIPKSMIHFPEFIPFFLLTFPFRVNPEILKLLEDLPNTRKMEA